VPGFRPDVGEAGPDRCALAGHRPARLRHPSRRDDDAWPRPGGGHMRLRTRGILLAAICVMSLGAAVAFLFVSRNDQRIIEQSASAHVPQTSLAAVEAKPHIVFRNTTPGASYGTVAVVSLNDPTGPRAITTTPCERVYATSKNMICLSSDRGFITTYGAHILDNNLKQTQTLPFIGIP